MHSKRTRGNRHKLQQAKSKWAKRTKKIHSKTIYTNWDSLPREAAESPPMEIFTFCLHVADKPWATCSKFQYSPAKDLFLSPALLGSLQARSYMVENFPEIWMKKWLQNEWQYVEIFVFSGFLFFLSFLKLKYKGYHQKIIYSSLSNSLWVVFGTHETKTWWGVLAHKSFKKMTTNFD